MRAWLLISCVVACGPSAKHSGDDAGSGSGSGTDSGPLPHTLTGVTVTPTNPIIQLDLNASGAQGFIATANYADGVDQDVSQMVNSTVANPAVGAMSGAPLNIPGLPSAQGAPSNTAPGY